MLFQHLSDFLAHPFDPNNDGQTSALEWFGFVGLMLVIVFIWNVILEYMLDAAG